MTMHHVHDGDDLQAVIDAAQPGDVVKVHPGTYDNIVMRSGVSVEGATSSGTFKFRTPPTKAAIYWADDVTGAHLLGFANARIEREDVK